jgi:hypothetical protein
MTTTAPAPRAITRRPAVVTALVVVHLFLALGALAGGAALMASPKGGVIKLPISDLRGSPFSDFLIPGLILFVVLGVGPLVVAWALLYRPPSAALAAVNPCRGEYWGWTASGVIGVGLVIWIAVEALIIPYSFLQPFYGAVGVAIIVLTLTPGARAYYGR